MIQENGLASVKDNLPAGSAIRLAQAAATMSRWEFCVRSDTMMDQILKPGQKVRTSATQDNCVVEKYLGGGGQGEVYQAHCSMANL